MTAFAEKPKILCVDDDESILELIEQYVNQSGYDTLAAASMSEALDLLAVHASEVLIVFTDLSMPSGSGLDLRAKALELYPDIPFAMISGVITRDIGFRGVELKINAFIDKPFDFKTIRDVIAREGHLRAENIREQVQLQKIFLDEASGVIEELEPLILSLEQVPNDMNVINAIFRLIHTIKGSGAAVGMVHLQRLCHAFEESLELLKKRTIMVNPGVITVLLRGLDLVKKFLAGAAQKRDMSGELAGAIAAVSIAALKQSAELTSPSVVGDAEVSPTVVVDNKHVQREQVRVPAETLDELIDLSGEIRVIRKMVNKLVRSITVIHPGDRDVGLLAELFEEMHKVDSRMQSKVVDLRKIPLSNVFRSLPRTVRELSLALKKEIQLITAGEEIRVDNAIGSSLNESLIHLIRNAADHGLEGPEERRASGKGERGTIRVSAEIVSEEVVVKLQDDGRGIDPEKIKARALERKMAAPEVIQRMSKNEVLGLIFEPGFSTAAIVSDVSGRGVGMDMVKTSIERLSGKILVSSDIGAGTCFQLNIPVPRSVVIFSSLISSLLVVASERVYVIPQDAIKRLLRFDPSAWALSALELQGGKVLQTDSGLIPLLNLSEILGLSAPVRPLAQSEDISIVHLSSDEGDFGLVVDQILDSEDVMVKPAGAHINTEHVFAGVTLLGDGTVGLIIDVKAIGRRAGIHEVAKRVAPSDASGPKKASQDKGEELLIFRLAAPGLFAVPLAQVFRLEEFSLSAQRQSGGLNVVIYRDAIVRLESVSSLLGLESQTATSEEALACIIVQAGAQLVALVVDAIVDIATATSPLDANLTQRRGLAGHIFVGDQTAAVLDVREILRMIGFKVPTEAEKVPSLDENEKDNRPDIIAVKSKNATLPKPVAQVVEQDAVRSIESPTMEKAAVGWGVFE